MCLTYSSVKLGEKSLPLFLGWCRIHSGSFLTVLALNHLPCLPPIACLLGPFLPGVWLGLDRHPRSTYSPSWHISRLSLIPDARSGRLASIVSLGRALEALGLHSSRSGNWTSAEIVSSYAWWYRKQGRKLPGIAFCDECPFTHHIF